MEEDFLDIFLSDSKDCPECNFTLIFDKELEGYICMQCGYTDFGHGGDLALV